jgi:DNA repair protein RadD
MLNNLGNGRAVFICGDSPDLDRFAAIAGFKAGAFKYLVNVNLLTTGFNARNCDAIAVLRATVSPGLFAQIVGRGLRTCPPEKKDCLLLDFGENLQRHGPIDSMHFGKKIHRDREGNERATGGGGGLKTCPNCEELCERMVRICECGFLFKTLSEKPDNESPILSESTPPKLVEFLVHSVSYSRHVKKGDSPSPPSLRVTYACHEQNVPSGNLWMHEKVDEWVCFEHEGFAKKKAADWWAKRSSKPIPGSIISVLAEIDSGAIIAPSRLWARKEGHWWRIDRVEFEDEKPSDQEGEDGWPPELETDYSQAEMPF